MDGIEVFMYGLLFGLGLVAGLAIASSIYYTDISELGNAICSESHQGKFISYSDKIVKCESIKETIKYDGIRIEIDKGEKQ